MTFLDEALTRHEAAAKSCCHVATLDRAIKAGELGAYQVGAKVVILPADLAAWIQTKKIKPVVRCGRKRQTHVIHRRAAA